MRKFDWNHALTRKDFALCYAWSMGFAVLVYATLAVGYYWDEIKSWIGKMKNKIRTKLPW